MERKFAEISDKIEKGLSHPYSFFLFIAWCIFVPVWSVDVANYGISCVTAFVLFISMGAARRDRLAMHVKLDDLETNIEEADTNKAGIEKLPEEEIKKIAKEG